MLNLNNLPAYNAINAKLEENCLNEGFRQPHLNAKIALEGTFMFIDTLEKAKTVKHLSGSFMGHFVVNVNMGNHSFVTRSNSANKVKSPSKYDLLNRCLDLGLVTEKQRTACQTARLTKQMLQDMLAVHGRFNVLC